MKILIVKTSSMGDIIHALPVAWDIAHAFPEARIDWAAEASFRDIPRMSPFVDEIKVSRFRGWRKSILSKATRDEVAALKADLASEHYDAVVDLQGLVRSAWLASWTRVPVTGYSRRAAKEPLAAWFYEKTLEYPASIPTVRRYRAAAAEALGYEVDLERVHYGLSISEPSSVEMTEPYAALCINTSRDSKLWPEEDWVEIGRRLNETGRRSVLFWGSETERKRSESVASRIEGAVVAPRTGLLATGRLIAGADAVLGVDTGLTHLGAALGRPSVGIFVSTPTDRLSLVGEGPVRSLGEKPSVEAVWRSFETVLAEYEQGAQP